MNAAAIPSSSETATDTVICICVKIKLKYLKISNIKIERGPTETAYANCCPLQQWDVTEQT